METHDSRPRAIAQRSRIIGDQERDVPRDVAGLRGAGVLEKIRTFVGILSYVMQKIAREEIETPQLSGWSL